MNPHRKKKKSQRVFLRAFIEQCEARNCMAGDLGMTMLSMPSNYDSEIPDVHVESIITDGQPTLLDDAGVAFLSDVANLDMENWDQAIGDLRYEDTLATELEENSVIPEPKFPPTFDPIYPFESGGFCDFNSMLLESASSFEFRESSCEILNSNVPIGLIDPVGGEPVGAIHDPDASVPGATYPQTSEPNTEFEGQPEQENSQTHETADPEQLAPTQNVSAEQTVQVPRSEPPDQNPIGPQLPLQSDSLRNEDVITGNDHQPIGPRLNPPSNALSDSENSQAFVSFSSSQLSALSSWASSVSDPAETNSTGNLGENSGRTAYFAPPPDPQIRSNRRLPTYSEQDIAYTFELAKIAGLRNADRHTAGLFSVESSPDKRHETLARLKPNVANARMNNAEQLSRTETREAQNPIILTNESEKPNEGRGWRSADVGWVLVGILTFWDEKRASKKYSVQIGAKPVTNQNDPDPLE
jgi:hypothetical protein